MKGNKIKRETLIQMQNHPRRLMGSMATNKDAQSDLRISFLYQIQLEKKTNTAGIL